MNNHRREDQCPKWCHICPHMNGQVMPWCFGTAARYSDEFDLTHCTCNPADPFVTQLDLISRTNVLLIHLREGRRIRNLRRRSIDRLSQLAELMKTSGSLQGHLQAWREVESIASSLRAEIRGAI